VTGGGRTSRRVAVIGFGVTGRAVARALVARGDQPVVFDDRGRPDADADAAAAAIGVTVERTPVGSTLAARLAGCDLVVPSPGVPFGHPVYAAAAAAGIPVQAEIELAAETARRAGGPRLVAITGTNGKTTVTTLVTAILRASGVHAVAAGNIGVPMIEAVASGTDVVVAEVSSFQLQFTDTFHPAVSCWLNLAPDHLDWHPTLAHYGQAKARVWVNQAAGDIAVFNADDPIVAEAATHIGAGVQRVNFSMCRDAEFRIDGGRLVGPGGRTLLPIDELPRSLPHDQANALAAAAVALGAGATVAGCHDGLAGTPPLPHRVSLVGESGGVRWYDDSKATTPASVLAAVAGFPSVVLIAGGRNKGLDLSALAATAPPVRAVIAIGEAAADVEAAFAGLVPVTVAPTMEAAVDAAARVAQKGDAVVLSPGCASFDWYPSYAARGDHFAAIVTRQLDQGERPC
jgi:UDP-N-acetylmuramoylalanine--D-glutamate ligase